MQIFEHLGLIPSLKSSEDQKQNGFHRYLRLYSARIWGIYSYWRGLFFADHLELKSRLGDAKISIGGTPNLDGGMLTLDGGTRPPCNLTTGYNHHTTITG